MLATHEKIHMKKIAVITSFNSHYYDLIGKFCVGSFIKNWPADIKLTCYVEEMSIEQHNKINQIDFSELPPTYFEFMESKYKNRVKTFAKKGYSIIHAMENLDCDLLIWIDSDVVTHTPVTNKFLEELCSDKTLASFMGVWHEFEGKDYFSCESSFFILNKKHKNFPAFSKRYREYYDNRLTENLRRFYDGEVLGATIKDLEHLGGMRELNPNFHKTPMPRIELNDHFSHLKAGLKEQEDLETNILSKLGDIYFVPVSQ